MLYSSIYAQKGIGTNNPDKSAVLELKSSNKGFLLPRLTAIQRDAIISPAEGLMVYCTDCVPKGLYIYTDTEWGLLKGDTGSAELKYCSIQGVIAKSVPITDASVSIITTELDIDTFDTKDIKSSNLQISGVTGVIVNDPSIEYIPGGNNVKITYPLSGTIPTKNLMTATLTLPQGINCTINTEVGDGYFKIQPEFIYTIDSSKSPTNQTLLQGVIDDDIILEIPIDNTISKGIANAYDSDYSEEILDDVGGNATRFKTAYPTTNANAANLVVTVSKNTAGDFLVPRLLLDETQNLVTLPVLIDGNVSSIIKINIYGNNKYTDSYGNEYKHIVSPVTGRKWLDRNLGATRAATSYTDSDAFGSYFQYGRKADGHELLNSSTQNTQINFSTQSNKFIKHAYWATETNYTSWGQRWARPSGASNQDNWNVFDNPCPDGFHVPMVSEFMAEKAWLESTQGFDAFNPVYTGKRDHRGNYVEQTSHHYKMSYWALTNYSPYSHEKIYHYSAGTYSGNRIRLYNPHDVSNAMSHDPSGAFVGWGQPIRCINNQ